MKKQLKKAFPYVMLLTAWAVIFAAVLLGERIPKDSAAWYAKVIESSGAEL